MDIIIKINSGVNLFDEKLTIVIIFSIFKALACFFFREYSPTPNFLNWHYFPGLSSHHGQQAQVVIQQNLQVL